jgi:hypothetical protein
VRLLRGRRGEGGSLGGLGWQGGLTVRCNLCSDVHSKGPVHTLPPPTCLPPHAHSNLPPLPCSPTLPALPAPPAAHGTNVDGAWIKAKVPKQLQAGSVLKFGASAREYRVVKLPQPAARR